MSKATANPGFAESVAVRLQSDANVTGERWWTGPQADYVVDLAVCGPFLVALAGLIDVLREARREPVWVLGATNANAAVRLAHEWIDAGVNAEDVADWLRAGCYEPVWAKQMNAAGIAPANLLDEDGLPLHVLDEGFDEDGLPLAQAVTEKYVTVGWAIKYLAAGSVVA